MMLEELDETNCLIQAEKNKIMLTAQAILQVLQNPPISAPKYHATILHPVFVITKPAPECRAILRSSEMHGIGWFTEYIKI